MTFASLRASGLASLLKPTGENVSCSFYSQMKYVYISPKLQISKPHVNTPVYLCSISSPVTQKEIRGEAHFMWASCFVKLTHSEHLMFPLSVKKLKIKILCGQIVFQTNKIFHGLIRTFSPLRPTTAFIPLSAPISSHLNSPPPPTGLTPPHCKVLGY